MIRVMENPKYVAKVEVAVEEWRVEKCINRHKMKSGQDGVTSV